jgi:hypothetical protein
MQNEHVALFVVGTKLYDGGKLACFAATRILAEVSNILSIVADDGGAILDLRMLCATGCAAMGAVDGRFSSASVAYMRAPHEVVQASVQRSTRRQNRQARLREVLAGQVC